MPTPHALLDACGHSLSSGGHRRVGPERKYYHRRSSSSVVREHPTTKTLSPPKTSIPEAGRRQKQQQQQQQQRAAHFPDMTRHRKQKLESSWYSSKIDPCIGPYAHTAQRSVQLLHEQHLSAHYADDIHRHQLEVTQAREARHEHVALTNSSQILSVPRLRTPEESLRTPTNWDEVLGGSNRIMTDTVAKCTRHQQARNEIVPGTSHTSSAAAAPSLSLSSVAKCRDAPLGECDNTDLRVQHLSSERAKRADEVVRRFTANKAPAQCSLLLEGLLSDERAMELQQNKYKFLRPIGTDTSEVERAAFEDEYRHLVLQQQQQQRTGNFDFAIGNCSSDLPLSLVGSRPSERFLGAIPLTKAYPYQRQIAKREAADERHIQQSMLKALNASQKAVGKQ